MNPKALLEQYDIVPRKSLGQNFLHDPNMLDKIVATAGLHAEDTVLEVGPGTGLLTERLARAVARVVTVEVDERLKPVLEETLAPYENVELIFQDILHVDVETVMRTEPYSVVANVPYYITSAILRHLLEIRHRPRRLVLTVQFEVAERLIAKPNDMSILAVSVQFYGRPQIAARLKPSVFWPRPDVDSALVLIDTFQQPPVEIPNEKLFFRVVRAGFGQKRKQLKNSISSGLDLNAEQSALLFRRAEIDPSRRPETLRLEEWAALARAFAGL
ncbi:MAG: 16S rRNA (adenine(1518)-N(6)/adenine(1519)-N(6))-dimethyltransferase RsmA [Anaerolineae bacterium]|nr:16S rRNA (adenine(1518)-N(6)/adenine(1519)-N(6))-dimethyltransferase RsmA [Anaerolineae bacterium]